MEVLILVVHVIAALAIIGLVLIQHGKGADVGAAFGGGASGSLFGSSGSANFLSRTTSVLAAIFFVSSISLTVFSGKKADQKGLMGKPASSAPASSMPAQIPAPPATVPASEVPVPAPGGAKAGGTPK